MYALDFRLRPQPQTTTSHAMVYSLRTRASSKPSAWETAQKAVGSFDGSQPPSEIQKRATRRWNAWTTNYLHPGHIKAHHFPEITRIFSDMFFLGKLSALQVHWHPLPADSLGVCRRSSLDSPCVIFLSSSRPKLFDDSNCALGVLLHEMTHAYLEGGLAAGERIVRAHTKPRKKVAASKEPQSSHQLELIRKTGEDDRDRGISGHGRAWQYVATAIEKHMENLLDLSCNLGRINGMATEICEIAIRYQGSSSLRHAKVLIEPILDALADMPFFHVLGRLLNCLVDASNPGSVRFAGFVWKLIQDRVVERAVVHFARRNY